ncbi:MAG: decarboxylase [Candidatus Aenigmarchaeota archaeon]|nr:decarboxylase [Candidatus Aenigmarchaeota archaeon]
MKSRFIVSRSKLLSQYKILKDLGLKISYSLKTFPEIAHILEDETDSFFTIHMMESFSFVKDHSRIWFVAQAWSKDQIKSLIEKKVRNFIVDNETDLKVLIEYLEKKDVKINLLLRLKMREHTIHTGKYFVFGMYSKQINEWIPKLRKIKNIEKLGIHFHRKTQNTSEWNIKDELTQMIAADVWGMIDIVNIGGGLPVDYKNTTARNIDFIFQKIKELREWLNDKGIEMIIEPGRFLAAPPTKLETEILSIHENNIIVDASVYNGSMDSIIVPIKLLVENEVDEGENYVIKGCTPCSMDIFRYDVKLKEKPKVGDKIVFLNAGAYCFTTDFCNLPKLPVVFVD